MKETEDRDNPSFASFVSVLLLLLPPPPPLPPKRFLGKRKVDDEALAHEFLSVHLLDGSLSLFVFLEFEERVPLVSRFTKSERKNKSDY